MNIEESVTYIKEKIKNKLPEYTETFVDGKPYRMNVLQLETRWTEKTAEAIETLLTAYEKEKGENVKLRLQDIPLIQGELEAYKDRVNELKQELEKEKEKNKKINKYIEDRAKIGKDIQTFINKDYVEQEYISKDELKEIIKEIREDKWGGDKETYTYWNTDKNTLLVEVDYIEKRLLKEE